MNLIFLLYYNLDVNEKNSQSSSDGNKKEE